MVVVGVLLKKWPHIIIEKRLPKKEIFVYKFKHVTPYPLGKYYDYYIGAYLADIENPAFISRLNKLRSLGYLDEIQHQDRIKTPECL